MNTNKIINPCINTEFKKKCVVLSIVVYFCGEKRKLHKKQCGYCYFSALVFLPNNYKTEHRNNVF